LSADVTIEQAAGGPTWIVMREGAATPFLLFVTATRPRLISFHISTSLQQSRSVSRSTRFRSSQEDIVTHRVDIATRVKADSLVGR
jgi:hypothetical protein